MLRWHPPRSVLDLAELVVDGALRDWPAPLAVPAEIAEVVAAGAPSLEIEDAEGTPVARLAGLRLVGAGAASPEHPGSRLLLARSTAPIRPFSHGPLRASRVTPARVHELLAELGAGPRVLAVAARAALSPSDVAHLEQYAGRVDAVLWLALVGQGQRHDLPAEALYRGLARVAAQVEVPGLLVPVALPAGTFDERLTDVAAAYGATQLAVLEPVPEAHPVHEAFAQARARLRRPPGERGVTVFFTGLSGSGKSTLAKALADRILEQGERTLTLLDGDEVRRLLSHGLGFSRLDRDLNIRRIGFVAAEVTRHGGIAICAPIAPFAAVRAEVRELVEEAGDFVLVHVATPLAECERRDRKGLYARARQGEIAEFTGISSPYEDPVDADLVVDTTGLSIDDALDPLWKLLIERGYVDLALL